MTVTRKNLFTIVISALLVGNMATNVLAAPGEPIYVPESLSAPSLRTAAIRTLKNTKSVAMFSSLNPNDKETVIQYITNIIKVCFKIDEPITYSYEEDLDSVLTQCITMLEMANRDDEIDNVTTKELKDTIGIPKEIALNRPACKTIIRVILNAFILEIERCLQELNIQNELSYYFLRSYGKD